MNRIQIYVSFGLGLLLANGCAPSSEEQSKSVPSPSPPPVQDVQAPPAAPDAQATDIPQQEAVEPQFTHAQVCRAAIATIMGKDPAIIVASDAGSNIRLAYTRKDDGSEWTYKCKIEGSRVLWGSPTGRWRDDPADSRVSFREQPDGKLEIEDRYSDGSSTKESYTLEQLR